MKVYLEMAVKMKCVTGSIWVVLHAVLWYATTMLLENIVYHMDINRKTAKRQPVKMAASTLDVTLKVTIKE